MKRVFLLIVLVMVVSFVVARSPRRRDPGLSRSWAVERRLHDGEAKHHSPVEAHRETRRALVEARQALDEVRDEVRHALDEVRDDLHEALADVRGALVSGDDPPRRSPPVPPAPPTASETAEGIPVSIVPGTRVSVAEPKPPTARNSNTAVGSDVSPQSTQRTMTGQLSASKDRAMADARRQLREEVANWLDPDVPHSWTPPSRMLDELVVDAPRIKAIQKDYGELFEATLTVDTSPRRRTALIDVYRRELVDRRLVSLGSVLAFVLICLAVISGYIRADEATKGYYTTRLRMLAAAGVGASGVILYHMAA